MVAPNNPFRTDVWLGKFNTTMLANGQRQTQQQIEKLGTSIDEIKEFGKSIGDIKNHTTATVVLEAFRGSAESAMQAAEAFKRGDTAGGAAAIMRSVGSMSGLFALGGPWGVALATGLQALLSIISGIISYNKEAEPTLEEVIEKLLKESAARDIALKLKSADATFKAATLAFKAMDDGTHTFHDILQIENFITGPGQLRLEDGLQWLTDEENQGLDIWETVFSAYVKAIATHLTDMLTATSKLAMKRAPGDLPPSEPPTPPTDATIPLVPLKLVRLSEDRRVMFAVLWYTFQRLEAICEALEEIVANKGTVWHVGNNRTLYHRSAVVRKNGSWPAWKGRGGTTDVFAIGDREPRIWTIEAHRRAAKQLGESGRSIEQIVDGKLSSGVSGDGPNSRMDRVSSCSVIARPRVLTSVHAEDMVLCVFDGLGCKPVVFFWQVDTATWSGVGWSMHPTQGTLFEVDQVWAVAVPAAHLGGVASVPADRFYALSRTEANGHRARIHYVDFTAEMDQAARQAQTPDQLQNLTPPPWTEVPLTDEMVKAGVRGITGDDRHLLAYCNTKIWRRPHAKVSDSKVSWELVEGPTFRAGSIRSDWWYDDVSLCLDGTMLVVADQQLWLRSAGERGVWTRADDAQATKAKKVPVLGYQTYAVLKELAAAKIEEFKTSAMYEQVRTELGEKGLLRRDANGKITEIAL